LKKSEYLNGRETLAKPVVLIVDDQPINIEPLGHLLREEYRVLVAASGPKALKMTTCTTPPDVILLDVIMPDMDGYEVCKRLKANAQTHDIPVIFVTVKDKAKDEETGFRLGAVDYITKPFNPHVVRARVRNQVKLKRRTQMLKHAIMDRRILLDNIQTQVWYLTDTHTYGAVNRSHADFLGVRPQDIAFKSIYHFMPEEEAEGCRVGNIEVFASGRTLHSEEWVTNAFGNKRLLSITKSPKLDEKGRVEYVVCSAEDITERKRVEAEIKSARDQYQALVDNIPGVTYRCMPDKNWTMLYISESVNPLSGYPSSDFVHNTVRTYASVIHSEDRELVEKSINRAVAEGESWDIKYRIRHKEGEIRWVHEKGRGVYSENGSVAYLDGFMTDITPLKEAEEEHEKLQAQLIQAQKMESVGRLAGGIAHDFNNKLTIINGYAEIAIDMMDPSDPLRKTIQEIHTAGKRSADIVRHLLAFARQQTISPVLLDLNDTVSSMLKMLQRTIGENIDLAWHPGKNLWMVKMDPSQVDQVLVNLAVNARDAISDAGKLTIETKNTTVDADYCKSNPEAIPGPYVMLAVSDDGCGIESDVKEQLFEPFFTTKELGKGTGLGLPIVYGIAKQNRGFVNVYSESGKGTTFKIYFPSHEPESSFLPSADESMEAIPMGSETILLVEDEPAILKMCREMIGRLGYTVLTAKNPKDALRVAVEHGEKIILLITDVVMPEMNGRELSSQLLKTHNPDLKTLYMSGYTANVIAHHGVLDEEVKFIQKPFLLKDLAVKIRKVIEEQ